MSYNLNKSTFQEYERGGCMGKRFVRKLLAFSICVCLAAEGLSYVPVLNVRAEEISGTEEPEKTDDTEKEGEVNKISLDDNNIEVYYIGISSKVEGDNNQYYYTGKSIIPSVKIYYYKEITDEEYAQLDEENRKEENGIKFQKIELDAEEYEFHYDDIGKELGEYKLVVAALDDSKICAGSREIPYEIIEKEHAFGNWKTTIKETVLKEGEKERTCSICGLTEKEKIAKTPATIKVNMTTIRLKRKQSTTKFKVSGLVKGDSVKSYKSSDKKIFTVDKNGKITAKNKSGSAKLTITLMSGKKENVKVKVQKKTVKTTKLTVNTSSLVLLKGGNYTLKSKIEPLTSGEKVTYKSSNKKVATVSSKGIITARKKGTANITIQSGSIKKTCEVQVIVKTFPKGDTNAFLKACKKIADTIVSDGNWIYYSGSGMKKSFVEARDYTPRQTSCANFVNFCMQEFGSLEPGMAFYSDGNAKLTYQGSSSKKKETKALVEKNYDILNIGGKKAIKAELEPGDICLYKGHTNVFAGYNSDGVPMWYDGGRNSTSDGKPQSGYFTNMYRASYFNSMPIYTVLRLKK